jgi:hypothetical protein
MPTQCSRDLFGHEAIDGRQVVAAFDGGQVTSDADWPPGWERGPNPVPAANLPLGATDRMIGLVTRFAGCFADGRAQAQVEPASRPCWHSGC